MNLFKPTFGNLGKRDLDLEYDWVANSPDQPTINAASEWLAEQVKEAPNDEIQITPEHDYTKLKGEQGITNSTKTGPEDGSGAVLELKSIRRETNSALGPAHPRMKAAIGQK
jgi:hypothetical protein